MPAHRQLFIATAIILLCLVSYTAHQFWLAPSVVEYSPSFNPPSLPTVVEEVGVEEWDISNVVLGPPTAAFRGNAKFCTRMVEGNDSWPMFVADNLRPDGYYLTAWVRGGFTNLFIGFTNMIYLGIISERVPVVPPFAPCEHISPDASILPFGDIFDMEYLRAALRTPILEWSDIKTTPPSPHFDSPPPPTPISEPLGCWTSRERTEPDAIQADGFFSHLKLDVAYTRLPDFTYRSSRPEENYVNTWGISSLIFPDPEGVSKHAHTEWPLLRASPEGVGVSPDVQMACFDTLYYMGTGAEVFDWDYELAREYVGKALGVSSDEPFITVHIRRGDFANSDPCREGLGAKDDCLAPLSAFQRRVHQVQVELLQRTGVQVTRVIVSSDERDPKFWEQVDALGWHYNDHEKERTIETYGEWYAPS
ncbi:hypothetical protein CPB85DRAFT_1433872 [Mucidula mucida]|nr:hypothetical protein CPB85DRAFT_1433872 [Mucidula mucida]